MKRNVMLDGRIYTDHDLMELDSIIGEQVIARVDSSADGLETLSTFHALPYQDGMTASQAETLLWALPDFSEYVDANPLLDEVLAILTDEQAATVPSAFHAWAPDTDYAVGDRVKYGWGLYKCLQAHTSQDGWEPNVATSMWACILNPDPEVIPVWVQPDSTNPYMTGDKVHYPDADGPVYESTVDNNVWSPETYGWQLVGGGE